MIHHIEKSKDNTIVFYAYTIPINRDIVHNLMGNIIVHNLDVLDLVSFLNILS